MCYQHGFDFMAPVGGKRVAIALNRSALAPLRVKHLNLELQPLAHVDPQMAELSKARGQHAVSLIEAVLQRRLPATGARRRKQDRLAGFGLEYLLQLREDGKRELGKSGRPVVLHCNHHRPLHTIGNVGWPWDKKEIATCHPILLGPSDLWAAHL